MKRTKRAIQSNKNFDTFFKSKFFAYLVIGLILLFVGKKILNSLTDSIVGKSEEEKAHEKWLQSLHVNQGNLTITDEQAKKRADDIYNGLVSGGSKGDLKVIRSLVRTEYQDAVTQGYNSTQEDSFTSFMIGDITKAINGMMVWNAHESMIKLTNDDLTLIAQKFGIRSAGLVNVEFFDILDYTRYEAKDHISQLVVHIYRHTQLS